MRPCEDLRSSDCRTDREDDPPSKGLHRFRRRFEIHSAAGLMACAVNTDDWECVVPDAGMDSPLASAMAIACRQDRRVFPAVGTATRQEGQPCLALARSGRRGPPSGCRAHRRSA